MSRLLKTLLFTLCLLLLAHHSLSPVNAIDTQESHPLRPRPNILTNEEKKRPFADETQTLFCAQRPTAVENQTFDKRSSELTLQISGTLTSNFESFIAPLLSVTDQERLDYDLSYENKAKRYLADYLGGRAYYELSCEDLNCSDFKKGLLAKISDQLTSEEITAIQSSFSLKDLPQSLQNKINSLFIIPRYGVFRKLTPQALQDKYKRAIILRAKSRTDIDELKDLYGFAPASQTVPNYPVVCWSNNRVVNFVNYSNFKKPCGKHQTIRLSSFNQDNWAPIPEDFPDDYLAYQTALRQWQAQDDAKWAKVWPYVPMFSREDTQGYIKSFATDEIKPVKQPHLARTYELSSALSNLLTPKNEYDFDQDPNFPTPEWYGIPWYRPQTQAGDPWWIDSSSTLPQLALGPVCDPQDPQIASSGDLAHDSLFDTPVNSPTQIIENEDNYDPTCDQIYDPELDAMVFDESNCDFKHDVRYSPDYFITRTPYLNQIANRLISDMGVFNIFRTEEEIMANQPENWPGIGLSAPEEPPAYPTYDFDPGSAEAGMKEPSNLVKFFYKGLGFVHCQKEKILATLTPAMTAGQSYRPFALECPLELADITNICTGELMAQLNPPSQTTPKAASHFQTHILPKFTSFLLNIYAKVEAQTGVPCEVLAGIHFRESDSLTGSLISGRPIGQEEPDAGGETFDTLEATAFHAAESLKQKVGLQPVNRPDQNFKDIKTLTTALARYNGLGNSNCRSSYSCDHAQSATAPGCNVNACCDRDCRDTCDQQNQSHQNEFVYPIPSLSFCPAKFEGDDSNYAVNHYDNPHDPMYILFCLDHVMCQPQIDSRPGALTVAVEFYNNLSQ